jgi:hypothetical protein
LYNHRHISSRYALLPTESTMLQNTHPLQKGENDPKVRVAPCCYYRIEAMQEWILFDYRILLPPSLDHAPLYRNVQFTIMVSTHHVMTLVEFECSSQGFCSESGSQAQHRNGAPPRFCNRLHHPKRQRSTSDWNQTGSLPVGTRRDCGP